MSNVWGKMSYFRVFGTFQDWSTSLFHSSLLYTYYNDEFMRFEDSQKAFPCPGKVHTRPNFSDGFGWGFPKSSNTTTKRRNDETDDFRVRHRAWFDDFEEGMPWELTLVGRQAELLSLQLKEVQHYK